MSEPKSNKSHKPPTLTPPPLNLKIKTLNGMIYHFVAPPDNKIIQLQPQIQQKTGVPPHAQRILFKAILLDPQFSLQHYNINEGDTLQLVANLLPQQLSSPSISTHRHSEVTRTNQMAQQNLRTKKHRYMQQRINGFAYKMGESVQTLKQNKQSIDRMFIQCVNNYKQKATQPFNIQNRELLIGDWVDMRDLSGVWVQGQVVAKKRGFVEVHCNGYPDRWNEWVDQCSDRLMPLRTQTVQNQDCQYLSPFPCNKVQIKTVKNAVIELEKVLAQMPETLHNVVSLFESMQFKGTRQHSKFPNFKYSFNEEEQQQQQQISQSVKNNQIYQNNFQTNTPVIKPSYHNDSLSKCEDISNKGEHDDGESSAKSFGSKKSDRFIDASSMKSLNIDTLHSGKNGKDSNDHEKYKKNIFILDRSEAQSVKQVQQKDKQTGKSLYYYNNQEGIMQEQDSQINQQINQQFYLQKKKELTLKLRATQLAPICDRLGRMLIDLAPHLASMGYHEQAQNYSECLSTATNQGSLQSRFKNFGERQRERERQRQFEQEESHRSSKYWNFQVPVMLTPWEIAKLNKLLSEDREHE